MSDLLNVEQFFGRSLDTVYRYAGIEDAPDGEQFRCSVCHKQYKTKSGAEKHLDKRNCHSAQDVFEDTEFERVMLNIVYYCNRRNNRPSKKQFRSHFHSYKPVAQLTGYMYLNMNEPMFELYIQFIHSRYKIKATTVDHKISSIAMIGQKESTLIAFREYLTKYQHIIPAPSPEMTAKLNKDPQEFVRALERCDISLDDAERFCDIDSLIEKMTEAQKIRLEEVCYQIEYANM